MTIRISPFTIVLIGFHLLFLITKIFIGDFFLMDSYEYYELAKNILTDFEFYSSDLNEPIDYRHYTKRPPLYSVFIIASSLFLKTKTGILLCQNIISICSILLIKKVFEENNFKTNNALYFFFIITSVNQFIYSNLIMSEIFFQFVIVLLIYRLHRCLEHPSWKNILWYQVVIILLFLTKPVFYLFIIPNFLITYLLYRKNKIRFSTISAILPILVFILYSSWNFKRTGSAEFSSIQNINLLEWNLKYFHENKFGAEKAKIISNQIRQEALAIDNYKKQQDFIKKRVISYLKDDIIGYSIFHAKGCVRIFIDPGRFDLFNFFKMHSENPEVGLLHHINNKGVHGAITFLKNQPVPLLFILGLILIFNLLKGIGFIWFWIKNYRKTNFVLATILFIILYIVSLTGPLGASRFFVPILPSYLIISALGFSDLTTSLKTHYIEKRRKKLLN
ncbi:glycosyltransferase family 39 protein [Aquimarina sp. LLG6339-5]|uniref:glycosyltransferase family 39 protein n=1 Tax=Aquimarina sp. LLG6339-5 TaxID=3160830 RepID=UPI00386965A1